MITPFLCADVSMGPKPWQALPVFVIALWRGCSCYAPDFRGDNYFSAVWTDLEGEDKEKHGTSDS